VTSPTSRGLTILFASHNGARTLPRMIAALERLDRPARPWRIVAVDNGSTDETAAVLKAAAARLPMTVLDCPTPGKMPSLIHGAREVEGDLVVMTDDDVEPAPGWLTAYERAADARPEFGLFGGPIRPAPLEPLSGWFDVSRRHHAELFARTDVGEGDSDPTKFFGPNFMLRREHLDLLSAIGAVLGPTFKASLRHTFPMGEDTQLMLTAISRGVRAYGVAAAAVDHLVRSYQTELDFMLQRAVRHGRGWAISYAGVAHPSIRRRLKVLGMGCATALAPARPESPDRRAFEALWRAHWLRGAALGAAFGPFEPRGERRTARPAEAA